jgi:hypothetical protein
MRKVEKLMVRRRIKWLPNSDQSERGKAHIVKISLPGVKIGQHPIVHLETGLQEKTVEGECLEITGPALSGAQRRAVELALGVMRGKVPESELSGQAKILYDTNSRAELVELLQRLDTRYRLALDFKVLAQRLRRSISREEQTTLIEQLVAIARNCPEPKAV